MTALLFITFCFFSTYWNLSVDFSSKRGFYDKPFSLTLTSDGSIVYTISISTADRTSPTVTDTSVTGIQYTAPINIQRTCIIRSLAYIKVGNKLTNISKIKIHTFIFLSDVVKQSILNQDVVTNYASNMVAAFTNIPSISFASPFAYPTQTSRTANPQNASIEWLDKNHTDDQWQMNIEYDMYGGGSRNFIKKNLKVKFRDNLDGDLEFDLFDGLNYKGVRRVFKFAAFNLRGGSYDSLIGTSIAPTTYIRGLFYEYTNNDLGLLIPRGRMVHVFFNTQYEGLYHLRERFNDDFMQNRLGSQKSDYETVQEWQNGVANREGQVSPPVFKNIVSNFSYPHIKPWIDWKNLFHFVMYEQYAGNIDHQDYHNWQAVGPLKPFPWQGKNGGWKFWCNDQDAGYLDFIGPITWSPKPVVVFDVSIDVTDLAYKNYDYPDSYNYNYPDKIFVDLVNKERHPDFMMMFWDSQYSLFWKSTALLSSSSMRERYFRMMKANSMNLSIIAEIARYGNNLGYYTNGKIYQVSDYYSQQAKMLNWFDKRLEVLKYQYTRNRWIFPLGAVNWSHSDNSILAYDSVITISINPSWKCYVTTNGEDPRLPGGVRNPSALEITQINLKETTILKARAFFNNTWGVIDSLTVRIKPQNTNCSLCGNIIISEIYYRRKSTEDVDGKRTPKGHFIELKNIGSKTMVLTGSKIKGIDYDFPTVSLKPNEFYVVSEYYEDFLAVYGVPPNDTHIGPARNKNEGQDTIELVDSLGNTIHEISFDDALPWSELADGHQYSLVPRNYSKDLSNVKNWRTSTKIGGSPWRDDNDFLPSRQINLVINEIYISSNKAESWIEFYNPSTSTSLWGWKISTSYKDLKKSNTLSLTNIGDNKIQVNTKDYNSLTLPFALDGSKEHSLYSFAAEMPPVVTSAPLPTMEYITEDISECLPGLSYGRHVLSTGEVKFVMLDSPTKNKVNGIPYNSPVIISAVGYQQPNSGISKSLQFIKITCVSTKSVSISGWTLGVGKKSIQIPFEFPPNTVLKPDQSVYVINSTTNEANFRYDYIVEANSLFFQSFTGFATLSDKITLRQIVETPNVPNYTVKVDGVPVDEFVLVLPNPGNNNPLQIERKGLKVNRGVIGYSGDVASWSVSPINLVVHAPTPRPTESPTIAPTPPTQSPTTAPTPPTESPTETPTFPTESPTPFPTSAPTPPTEAPTPVPTEAPTPPTDAPTRINDGPINSDAVAVVTWVFRKYQNRTHAEVSQYISPALRATTRYYLTSMENDVSVNFKREDSSLSDTWSATITNTDLSTTPRLESDALLAYLNKLDDVDILSGSPSIGSGGLSQVAIVALVLSMIILFLIVIFIVVLVVFSGGKSKKGKPETYEML